MTANDKLNKIELMPEEIRLNYKEKNIKGSPELIIEILSSTKEHYDKR